MDPIQPPASEAKVPLASDALHDIVVLLSYAKTEEGIRSPYVTRALDVARAALLEFRRGTATSEDGAEGAEGAEPTSRRSTQTTSSTVGGSVEHEADRPEASGTFAAPFRHPGADDDEGVSLAASRRSPRHSAPTIAGYGDLTVNVGEPTIDGGYRLGGSHGASPSSAGGVHSAPPSKFKTKICLYFLSPEGCPYGERCLYAHGDRELQRPRRSSGVRPSVMQHFKTRLCRFWVESGGKSCPHGVRCTYAHGQPELQAHPPAGVRGLPTAALPYALEGGYPGADARGYGMARSFPPSMPGGFPSGTTFRVLAPSAMAGSNPYRGAGSKTGPSAGTESLPYPTGPGVGLGAMGYSGAGLGANVDDEYWSPTHTAPASAAPAGTGLGAGSSADLSRGDASASGFSSANVWGSGTSTFFADPTASGALFGGFPFQGGFSSFAGGFPAGTAPMMAGSLSSLASAAPFVPGSGSATAERADATDLVPKAASSASEGFVQTP